MKIYWRNSKGFTLIELLVVIAIISLLSSIVFASLNSARSKAKDAAIKAAMTQVAILMALNFSDYGSYCQIQSNAWIPSTTGIQTCDWMLSNGLFSGIYAQKARDLCQNIYNNAADGDINGRLLIAVNPPPLTCSSSYSWQAHLNNGNWYCSGSSGAKGEYPAYSPNHPGCYDNP